MRVLAVGAHPDDLEIWCGGTLARYVHRGDEVIMCVCTNGDKGSYDTPSARLAEIRMAEARASAQVLGAECVLLGMPDGGVLRTEPQRALFTDLLRRTRPDVVLTHPPNDYMSDHVNASLNVWDASFWCSAPLFLTEHEALAHMPAVYYTDAVAGVNSEPTDYVDITDFWDTKVRMLLCHESQRRWLAEHDQIDYVDFMSVVARFRGIQCGVRYAEAFRAERAWPRVRPERLLP
jgi:LmbE family N-acetylglucosaminyl deacetylase